LSAARAGSVSVPDNTSVMPQSSLRIGITGFITAPILLQANAVTTSSHQFGKHDVSRLRRMMFDRALAPLGITRSQWWVLAFISRKDGLPQVQLANELDVGKVAVGALIDRLESSGFVIRQADPVDRRIKRVYVTKQARGFLQKLRKQTDKFNAKILNGIDRRQLEAASEALLAMKHNLLAMSDDTVTDNVADEEEDVQRSKTRKKRRAAA
jgi:MarR family transcriptional regulator for hemolysin